MTENDETFHRLQIAVRVRYEKLHLNHAGSTVTHRRVRVRVPMDTETPTSRNDTVDVCDAEPRGTRWPRACGATSAREDFSGHFRALVDLRTDDTHSAETSAQIEKDLPRVGSAFESLDLSTPGSADWSALRRVLLAFVSHKPDVGYVQSMHSIAAFLLLAGLDEEHAFWCLVKMVEEIVPGYFDEGMAAAKLDQRVFSRILRERTPAVGLHLSALGQDEIILAIMSSQWLLTLFVNVLPTDVTMKIWDEMFEARHRAALFASCVALLEQNSAAILETTEMGEAIELLQKVGESLKNDEDGSRKKDFIDRVYALLASDLSPAKVDQLTARVRGKQRRPSDVRLPKAITDVAALTDVDDLYLGLASTDLRDKLATLEDMSEHAWVTVSLAEELTQLGSVSSGATRRQEGDDDASSSMPSPSTGPNGEELNSISAKVVAIEAFVKSLPEHGDEMLMCVKHISLRPLRAVLDSRLGPFCDEITFLYQEFTAKTKQLREAVDRNVETSPDLSSMVLPSPTYGKSVWPLWSKSLFEDTVEQAEVTLESLEQIRAELSWMVSVFVGDRKKEIAPRISRADEWEDVNHERLEDRTTAEPDDACLSASSRSHVNEVENRLMEIEAMVKRTHEEAVKDLPVLRKNQSATTARLKQELSAEEDAVNSWAATAERRNETKQQGTVAKLKHLIQALESAYCDPPVEDDCSETASASAKVSLEQSHAAETIRLEAALAGIKNVESALSRRSNALTREKHTAESVRALSERALSQTNASLVLVYEAGDWLDRELSARGSDDFKEKFNATANMVRELSDASRTLCTRILHEWSSFVRKLTSQVVIEYVSIIDSAIQAIADTHAVLSRRDAAHALSSPLTHGLDRDHIDANSPSVSLRSLTSKMEKLTDIAGSKLNNFGNRLRNIAAANSTVVVDGSPLNNPPSIDASSSSPPKTEGTTPVSSGVKQSRLADDRDRLDGRREQLLAKKTWLRSHMMQRGE